MVAVLQPAVPAAEAKQLLLFEAIGVAELPQGIADLTGKEQKFVLALLRHGQMARAAIEAGYSETSAGAIASETLRKPKVFAFYQRCLGLVAANADQLTRRVCERSLILHQKAMTAAQDVKDLDELILIAHRDESGAKAKDVDEYETRREQAAKAEKHYTTLANQTDTLLASLLGKLQLNVNANVSGGLTLTLTPELQDRLVKARRELQAQPEAPKP